MKSKTDTRIPFFQRFMYPIDWKLNRELKEYLKYGIRRILYEGDLFIEVEFDDLSRYEFWNCERWEGWLKFGTLMNMWGQPCYEYENKRPTRRTMRRLLKELKKSNKIEIIKHSEVKQKFELNESLLKKLITEELGISKAIADKTEEVYAMLEDDISSNSQNKRKGNWWSVQEGSFSFKLIGVKVYVSYTCTDYNSDGSDSVNVFGTQQEASSVMTDSGSAFMFLNITSVNGKINSESAKDGIQHELEHIYQQTMSGGRFNDSEAYSEIVTMMRFGDEFERKVGRLLYGCVRSEQDGFVNGMYAYMMSIPGPFRLEVMKDTECARLYDEMVSIYNEIGNTEEFGETIRKFGYTTNKIDKKITAFAKKIARVISKVQKDKMSKQGLRF